MTLFEYLYDYWLHLGSETIRRGFDEWEKSEQAKRVSKRYRRKMLRLVVGS